MCYSCVWNSRVLFMIRHFYGSLWIQNCYKIKGPEKSTLSYSAPESMVNEFMVLELASNKFRVETSGVNHSWVQCLGMKSSGLKLEMPCNPVTDVCLCLQKMQHLGECSFECNKLRTHFWINGLFCKNLQSVFRKDYC